MLSLTFPFRILNFSFKTDPAGKTSMAAKTLRTVTRATRTLDLSASTDLICDNMMCAKVGALCLCKFSIALAKIGHISHLHLRSNGMDRWPEVWRILGLKVLDVADNRLSSVPPEIAQLTQLEELLISGNQLQSLPEELSALPNLRVIDVRNNQLRAIPESLRSIARVGDEC
jgi:hypothetical protein